MNRWKAILAATIIFVTGAGTGALVYRAANRASQETAREGRSPSAAMDGRFDFLGRLKRDLDLTEEQSKRIDVILQEGRKRNRLLWDSVQPQMREEMKLVRERIKAELNPEQQAKFDEMNKRSRERRGPRPEGSGPSPGGPGGGRGEDRRHGPGPRGTNEQAWEAKTGENPGGPGRRDNHGPPPGAPPP